MNKIYNLSKISELSENDPDFIKAMVGTFLEEIPLDLDQLGMAVVKKDRAQVHEYAHKMKPTMDMFGLSALGDILVLEAWGKSQDLMDVNEYFIRVKDQVQVAVTQLQADF